MSKLSFMILFLCVVFAQTSSLRSAPLPACELDRPVVFGGLDWDSNAFHTEVARLILERGYGCETDVIPGSTLPLVTGLGRGDVDILMEVWRDNLVEPWTEALARGEVIDLGINFPDAVQGWYVPRYLIEGDAARGIAPLAPDLKSVFDLPRYASLFRDAEVPDKGRFYNCILGWQCEVLNSAKLTAYGLEAHFTNFRPGTSTALAAAIAAAHTKGEPVLAYYWGPTWVLGTYDLVKLEEPAYSPDAWDLFAGDPGAHPPTAYPEVAVAIGANTKFANAAPSLVAFFQSYRTSNKLVSEALAYLNTHPGSTARDAARDFIESRPDIWRDWVPAEIAARVTVPRTEARTVNFPTAWQLPVTDWVNARIEAFVASYGGAFETVGHYVLQLILLVEAGLSALPWWLVLLLIAGFGFHATASLWAAGGFAASLFFVGALGLWDLAVQTLALTFVSVGLSLLIGLPVGIALAKMPRARRVATPLLDAMQTLPSFVYLIPALMLFGLGKVPAVFATIIYATPPLIRLTDLGVRLVADAYTEVAADLGATRLQQLRDIELPLALPNIMAGINQTIMMALSMVVIASMIGARGLGEQVLLGIQRLDVGQGLAAGLAIVALAVVFDRITQAYGKRDIKRVPLRKPFRALWQRVRTLRP